MIAITGATGVLGRAMTRHLGAMSWSAFEGDIRNYEAVSAWIDEVRPDAVLHFAAVVPVRRVEADPRAAFAINVAGTVNVCEALRASGAKAWMFVASSSHVYAPSALPIAENAPTDPVSLYGVTKLLGEQAALAYARHCELPVCVGRIFSFSAPEQAQDYLLPSLVRRLRECAPGATLPLRGAMQTRDFMTTGQIARIIDALRERRATGVFNIASGLGVRILDAANQLAAAMGRDDVQVVADGHEDAQLTGDVGKLRSIGIEPHGDLGELLGELAASVPKRTN